MRFFEPFIGRTATTQGEGTTGQHEAQLSHASKTPHAHKTSELQTLAQARGDLTSHGPSSIGLYRWSGRRSATMSATTRSAGDPDAPSPAITPSMSAAARF